MTLGLLPVNFACLRADYGLRRAYRALSVSGSSICAAASYAKRDS